MSQTYYVYTHARPKTTDSHGIFYVGKGSKERVGIIERKHNVHHTRIVNKHGKENIIIRKLACESEQHALDLEIKMIAVLRRIGVKLVNLTNGGEGASGFKHSNETKEKLRLINSGRVNSEETRRKLAIANTGKTHSIEAKSKQSEIKKGKFVSLETRAKMSKSQKGRKHSPETLVKMSKSQKGRRHSLEARAKISESHKSRPPISDETRAKISAANSNPSAETRAKISAAGIGRVFSAESLAKKSASMKLAWEKRKAEKSK